VVDGLLDLKAVETAAAIEQAYAAGFVDETVCGGWEEVRYELGLGEKPEEDFDPDFEQRRHFFRRRPGFRNSWLSGRRAIIKQRTKPKHAVRWLPNRASAIAPGKENNQRANDGPHLMACRCRRDLMRSLTNGVL